MFVTFYSLINLRGSRCLMCSCAKLVRLTAGGHATNAEATPARNYPDPAVGMWGWSFVLDFSLRSVLPALLSLPFICMPSVVVDVVSCGLSFSHASVGQQ
jgi:hypothetical protein